MAKKLSEMTLKELWQLFPIFLEEHKACWNDWYNDETARIKPILPQNARISHIGSTSINGIFAKPIVDIIVEVPRETNLLSIKDTLINNGYLCMNECPNRISFNKGYTEEGFAEKVFHLHLRYFGDNDELYFRDYLNRNLDVAKAYEKLKLRLWKEFEHDRDGYTEAKTCFVKKYTNIAKKIYKNKYN